jgi:hypothetical protein
MNIEKFKRQHLAILDGIKLLRDTVHEGIAEQAESIAAQLIAISGLVKLHLAVEDSVLYPALAQSDNRMLASLGGRYQKEMTGLAEAYFVFAARWNLGSRIAAEPEAFRRDANQVLRALHDRIGREDREFYPAIDGAQRADAG